MQTKDYKKLGMVVSVLVTFLLKVLKVSSIVESDHSNCSHQAQFTASERLQVQKENALTESEVLAWRRALYCKEKNAAIEKAHRNVLLG